MKSTAALRDAIWQLKARRRGVKTQKFYRLEAVDTFSAWYVCSDHVTLSEAREEMRVQKKIWGSKEPYRIVRVTTTETREVVE